MTLVIDALSRAAREVGIKTPSSWLAATREDQIELRDDFLLQTVTDLQDRIDLPLPIGKQHTITGDGSETYTLPTDFRRLARSEFAVYDSTLDTAAVPITSDGEWTYRKDLGTAGVVRYFRLHGYEENYTISLFSAPSAANTVVVSYVSNVWNKRPNATEAGVFDDEDSVLLLPREIIECGTVWRFRERRGLPYVDKYNEYETKVARLSNQSRGRRIVNLGARDTVRWQDVVPAFIPDS